MEKTYRKILSDVFKKMVCPLTNKYYLNPTIAEDGYIYEKDAIEAYVKKIGLSPITDKPMSNIFYNCKFMKELIKKYCDRTGKYWIHFICRLCNKEIIKYVIDKKYSMLVPDEQGNYAIHYLCKYSQIESILYAFDKLSDVNIKGCYGYTPLHILLSRF